MNRTRISELISLLKTRIGKTDSECGKKFWKILVNKSAENQSKHKDVVNRKKNQEHSTKNQERESGIHQECQEVEKNTGTKHMLGRRQLKLSDSNIVRRRGRWRIPGKTSRDPVSKSNISVNPSAAAKSALISRDIRNYFVKGELEDENKTLLRLKVNQGPGGDITKTRKTGSENQGN